jgi:hypothetical protein
MSALTIESVSPLVPDTIAVDADALAVFQATPEGFGIRSMLNQYAPIGCRYRRVA